MALEYCSYSYSCHFPSTNIFKHSFVVFWTTEYIRIFVRKFSKIEYIQIFAYNLILIFVYLFNEKNKSRHNLCIKKCSVKFYLEETGKKLPSNIIYFCIRAISGIWIYSDNCLVNILHPNIFGYSFGTYCGIPIYSDIHLVQNVACKYIRILVSVHFMIFAHHCRLKKLKLVSLNE